MLAAEERSARLLGDSEITEERSARLLEDQEISFITERSANHLAPISSNPSAHTSLQGSRRSDMDHWDYVLSASEASPQMLPPVTLPPLNPPSTPSEYSLEEPKSLEREIRD